MANDTDFSNLYHSLGLNPGCDLVELRLAYRRRVAALHPDRHQGDGDELQRLNALYGAALEFQRRNGRLPGAMPRARPAVRPAPTASMAAGIHGMATQDGTGGTRLRSIALLLLLLLFAALAWSFANDVPPGDHPAAEHLALDAGLPAARLPTELALGMSVDEVRRIEGAPIHAGAVHWEYGPSWVAFHCGRVSGWYSSPLHPLHAPPGNTPPPDRPLPRCRASATAMHDAGGP